MDGSVAYDLIVEISLDTLSVHLQPPAVDPTEVGQLRQAAVLVLLYPSSHGLSIPLIQRPKDSRHHPGQLALPGGAHDLADNSLMDTAVRETEEEIGIPGESLTLPGRLGPVAISVSSYQVFPFVATCPVKPNMTPNVAEVIRIVEMPVASLIQPGDILERPLPNESAHHATHAIRLREGIVWGATARILFQLASVLRMSRVADAI